MTKCLTLSTKFFSRYANFSFPLLLYRDLFFDFRYRVAEAKKTIGANNNVLLSMKKKRKKEGNINVQTHQARIIRGVFIFFNHICLLSSYERNQRKFSISQNSIASFNYH